MVYIIDTMESGFSALRLVPRGTTGLNWIWRSKN